MAQQEVTPKGPVAHAVKKGDPRVDGPYLDDIRAEQEDARRKARKKGLSKLEQEEIQKTVTDQVKAEELAKRVEEEKNNPETVVEDGKAKTDGSASDK